MNAFTSVPPKATPAPSKAPKRYVRGVEFEKGTQAVFAKLKQPPGFRIGQDARPSVDHAVRDATNALNRARDERSQRMSARALP